MPQEQRCWKIQQSSTSQQSCKCCRMYFKNCKPSCKNRNQNRASGRSIGSCCCCCTHAGQANILPGSCNPSDFQYNVADKMPVVPNQAIDPLSALISTLQEPHRLLCLHRASTFLKCTEHHATCVYQSIHSFLNSELSSWPLAIAQHVPKLSTQPSLQNCERLRKRFRNWQNGMWKTL